MSRLLKIPSIYVTEPSCANILELDDCWVVESNIQCGSRSGTMFLEDHILLFILEGKQTLKYGKQKYIVSKNEMILLKKATIVEFEKNGNPDNDNVYDSLMFCICGNFIQEFLAKANFRITDKQESQITPVSPMTEQITAFAYSLKPYFNNPSLVNPELLRLKITELLYNVTQCNHNFFYQLSQINQFIPTDIRVIVEQHYTSRLTLPELACLSGRSLSSFKRDFKSIYNISPAQWIRERRLEKAKDMLLNTKLPISDICYMIGFENLSHFSRLFKRYFNHPPTRYRN